MPNRGTNAEILDVKVSEITSKQVLEKIKSFLLSERQHYIVTLNPEMAVEAQKDEYFKKIINEADVVVPDGIGILLASRFVVRRTLPEKITGMDLIYKICESDFIKGKKIYLMGAKKGVVEKTAEVLLQKYSYLNIVGAEEGIPQSISNFPACRTGKQFPIFNKSPITGHQSQTTNHQSNIQYPISFGNTEYNKLNNELIQSINKAQPDILFVAFGAPKQEKWIYENLKKMPSVKLAMGVGGSFDFISGKVKRAPLIFQKAGLEWFWRLILEPWRFRRIYNATVKFGWLVLKDKYFR